MANLLAFAASMSRRPWDDPLVRDELRRAREAADLEICALPESERKCRICLGCCDPLPSYRRLCEFCRLPVSSVRVVDCAVCTRKFVAHGSGCNTAVTCSTPCRAELKAAKSRHKKRIRESARAILTMSDITPQQEAGMRARASKCPLCSVRMTGAPNLPNTKHLDHILPLNQGGTHTHGNVRIICATCNIRRPKDGSDYTGPLTLWAQAPGVSVVRRKKISRAAGSAPASAPER